MKLNKGYDQQATLPKRGEKKQQPIALKPKHHHNLNLFCG